MRLDRFVVGTGRCGSTLLSRMLAQHPDVCSLFEFFGGLAWETRFAEGLHEGEAFAAIVTAEQPMLTAVLRRGYEVAEVGYPFDDGGRHRRDDALPFIAMSMLPRLTRRPDSLFDALAAFARERPLAPLADHYRALFGWLAERTDTRHWIERSGSSIDYLGELSAMFPEARFVHLHRDGPETALSMRAHHAYRLPICLLYDAPLDDGRRPSECDPIDLHAPPRGDDTISRILASTPAAEHFGRYWSDQVVRGMASAPALGARYHEVPFEALVLAPQDVLAGVAAHLDLDPDAGNWRDRAAALLTRMPVPRVPDLPPDERNRLEAACAPGSEILG